LFQFVANQAVNHEALTSVKQGALTPSADNHAASARLNWLKVDNDTSTFTIKSKNNRLLRRITNRGLLQEHLTVEPELK
jgi:hypothetical protein